MVVPDRDGDGIPDAKDKCPNFKPLIDDDNDGCADHILSSLGFGVNGGAGGITLSEVQLTKVPRGARVSVTCSSCRRTSRGRTRRFRHYVVTAKKGGTQPMGPLNGLRIARRRQLVIVVTHDGMYGRKIKVVPAAGRRKYKRTATCLAIGSATKRVSCASGT